MSGAQSAIWSATCSRTGLIDQRYPNSGRPMQPETIEHVNDWGPAMSGLNERQRAFVLAMLTEPPARGAQLRAARRAGYGKPGSNAKTLSVTASRVKSDPRVQAAMQEEGQRHLIAAVPR